MKRAHDLTHGNILYKLTLLSLPIMGMSLIQMAYNMVDMIWIGRLGAGAVAAVGTAGFFLKLGFSLIAVVVIGAGAKTAQCVGKKDYKAANSYAKTALINTVYIIATFIIVLLIFRYQLIDFFQLKDPNINKMAINYLTITSFGIFFSAISIVITRIFNGYGNSKTPFLITSIGLILNIILDPILIFGIHGVLKLGVLGAAIATVIAQIVVFTILIIHLQKQYKIFSTKFRYNKKKAIEILKIGIPVATQRVLFTGISIYIAKIVSHWGSNAIAVQRVGVQIESLSWITAGGFQGALAAFIGQNYGAGKLQRIKKSYFNAICIISTIGIFVSFMLIVFPKPIFRIFLQEDHIVKLGANYLRILGISQLFMVIEMTTVGGFQGVGKTFPPSIVSIIFTGFRIPMALILSATALQLNGVWWSITISSIIKGVVLPIWFIIYLKKIKNREI